MKRRQTVAEQRLPRAPSPRAHEHDNLGGEPNRGGRLLLEDLIDPARERGPRDGVL
jgi:hypothetical protein